MLSFIVTFFELAYQFNNYLDIEQWVVQEYLQVALIVKFMKEYQIMNRSFNFEHFSGFILIIFFIKYNYYISCIQLFKHRGIKLSVCFYKLLMRRLVGLLFTFAVMMFVYWMLLYA